MLYLAEPYLGCGHHLFTDRYYTSLSLSQTLHSLQTGFTGIAMKNRAHLPHDIRGNLRLEHGQVAAFRADHLLALAWLAEKKKKPVVMVSTRSSAALTVVSSRKSHTPTVKLVVVDNYNHHMNGVDLADKHAVHYSFIRKTVKWWRKVMFCLVETAAVNASRWRCPREVQSASAYTRATYAAQLCCLPCCREEEQIIILL